MMPTTLRDSWVEATEYSGSTWIVIFTPFSAKRGSGCCFAASSLSSAYFTSDALKRNSKNSSCAVSAGWTGWS